MFVILFARNKLSVKLLKEAIILAFFLILELSSPIAVSFTKWLAFSIAQWFLIASCNCWGLYLSLLQTYHDTSSLASHSLVLVLYTFLVLITIMIILTKAFQLTSVTQFLVWCTVTLRCSRHFPALFVKFGI